MRRTLLIICFYSALSFFPCHTLPLALSDQAGADAALTDAKSIRAFADSLFHRGLLFRAAMEYERFLYLYPSHPETPGVLFNLATAAKLAGDRQSALNQYTLFLSRYPQHDLAGEVRKALTEIKETNYSKTRQE